MTATLTPQAHAALAAELKAHLSEKEQMKAIGKRLLEWNAKYPKSAAHMSQPEIVASELELDDIMADLQAAVPV